MADLALVAAGAAVLGVASHVGWFIRGEHDRKSATYLSTWSTVQAITFFTLVQLYGWPVTKAALTQTVASSTYIGGLFASMITYRLLFHRLNKFPGPLTRRFSKLVEMGKFANGNGFKDLDSLHRKYGTFVRVGPNHISTNHPAAPQLILGPGTTCTKPVLYDMGKPLTSLHRCRDKKLHDTRRRVWDKGFSSKSLKDYENRVAKYVDKLVEQLKAFGGGRVDGTKWFNYFAFDVMGDLAFGESFQMLDKGENHFAISVIEEGSRAFNLLSSVPWLFFLVDVLKSLNKNYITMIRWSQAQAIKRKNMKVDEPDIMSHLLDAPPMTNDPKLEQNWLFGDSILIIIAGSDTTSTTLSFAIYELIKNPQVVAQLRAEVSPLVESGTVDQISLQNCKYLNAVIDETLRLHPAVPGGLTREVPPEGITIGDTFIPGKTIIRVPQYSTHRSEAAFVRPDEFLPERWHTRPELVKNKRAWAPFSIGSFNCVGKNLAYMELRAAISRLVTEFDIDFAPGEDGSKFVDNVYDHFTVALEDLPIVCKPRKA